MNFNMTPQITSADRCKNNFLTCSSWDYRQCLTKVPSKYNSNTSKGFVPGIIAYSLQHLLQCTFKSFYCKLMLHWHLIPNNNASSFQNLMQIRITLYSTFRRFSKLKRNFKT